MTILFAQDYAQMSRKAANLISAQLLLKPDCVLGLATGSSPVGVYRQLVEWYQKGDLDFSRCRAVNLDEYCTLGPDDAQSYARFMQENLFSHVNILPEHTHIPNGLATDAEAECARYDALLRRLGGVDMQLLGIGNNGHIGFNEPGAAFEKGTHKVALTANTIEANRRFFASASQVPTHAYTMGIQSILQARRILLLASGSAKADILYRAFTGPISPEVPASVLQLHPDVTVVADAAALAVLLQKAPARITMPEKQGR